MRHAGDVLKDAAHPSSEDGDLERVLLRSDARELSVGKFQRDISGTYWRVTGAPGGTMPIGGAIAPGEGRSAGGYDSRGGLPGRVGFEGVAARLALESSPGEAPRVAPPVVETLPEPLTTGLPVAVATAPTSKAELTKIIKKEICRMRGPAQTFQLKLYLRVPLEAARAPPNSSYRQIDAHKRPFRRQDRNVLQADG